MAQTTFHTDTLSTQSPVDAAERHQLEVEKLGVIAGFLIGLPLALGVVQEALLADGLPTWAAGAAAVATVAVSTWLGLRAGSAVASHLRADH